MSAQAPVSKTHFKKIDTTLGPKHVAFIMDGNRRWARKNERAISEGHFKGAENLISICEAAPEMGVKVITAYSFSTENWGRSSDEIADLMELFICFLGSQKEPMYQQGVCLHHIGDMEPLPIRLQEKLKEVIAYTKKNTRIHLVLAINYGGRNEIVRAAKEVSRDVSQGNLDLDSLTEETFNTYLDTSSFGDPDLLIRTSGEYRLSNFLLWQLSYTEMFFTPLFWPEFSPMDLYHTILKYQERQRRIGGGK